MVEAFVEHYLQDVQRRFRRLKEMAERAMGQIDEAAFLTAQEPNGNSVALLVKHIAGNMRSRWRDLLTADGEKPDRHRDSEFELGPEDGRAALMAGWEEGWQTLFEALGALTPQDALGQVRIRNEAHSVVEAINRQIAHYAYHVGQIVLLSKHWAGKDWQWMSIPPGQSEQFNAQMRKQ